MCDLYQNGDLESDRGMDFSILDDRLNSFHGSNLAQKVPAERLARAGFYFTGNKDRVRCFSCQKSVENWCSGDTPVERHMEVSPSCTFLNCCHRPSFNPSFLTPQSNGSTYDEAAEDMQYRLSTGAVVDETPYPMVPHMKSEEARLHTFSSWPQNSPIRPRDLAQAGFYYLDMADHVQCFCCGGKLNGWEPEDNPWEEHTRHFSNCFFVLGHDVGNVPLQERLSSQQENSDVNVESFEERLRSFTGLQLPVDHQILARAGFYSTGTGDRVKCFRCGGGLKDWVSGEDPWEEHAKYYPGCSFLLEEKGREFINNIQLRGPQQSSAISSNQNGFSASEDDIPPSQSEIAQKAIKMGIESSVVRRTISKKIRTTGFGYSGVEALVSDCFCNTSESEMTEEEEDEGPLAKLQKLQREKQCKICMDRDVCIVFLPCAHMVSCKQCSESLIKCPICCGAITQKVKTYLA